MLVLDQRLRQCLGAATAAQAPLHIAAAPAAVVRLLMSCAQCSQQWLGTGAGDCVAGAVMAVTELCVRCASPGTHVWQACVGVHGWRQLYYIMRRGLALQCGAFVAVCRGMQWLLLLLLRCP